MPAKFGLLSEKGAASILVLAICAALVSVGAATIWLSQNITGQLRLQAQTESAALAVSQSVLGGIAGIPCENAKRAFTLNMVFLEKCLIVGDEVVVAARWQPFGFALTATATAIPMPPK